MSAGPFLRFKTPLIGRGVTRATLLGKWRSEFYAAPVENVVWVHQREYYAAIRKASADGDSDPFIDFMLDKILRTLKAKGRAYEASLKSDQKSGLEVTRKARTRDSEGGADRFLSKIG